MPSPSSWSAVTTIPRTGDPTVDAMLSAQRFAGPVITYSFPGAGSVWSTSTTTGYGPTNGGGEPWSSSFGSLSDSDRQHFRDAIQAWADVAGFTAVEVPDTASSVGDIRVAYTTAAGHETEVGWTATPSASAKAGDIWFNAAFGMAAAEWTPGSFQYYTLLHEIGHALGLLHGWDEPGYVQTWNSASLSVMAYRAGLGQGGDYQWYPTTPMILDIMAIQKVYGPQEHNAGDTTYVLDLTTSQSAQQTIWDTGGTDTLVLHTADFTSDYVFDLEQGHASFYRLNVIDPTYEVVPNLWIPYGTVIENVTLGDGSEAVYGNAANNVVRPGKGWAMVDGAGGVDTVVLPGNLAEFYIGGSNGYPSAAMAASNHPLWNVRAGTTIIPDAYVQNDGGFYVLANVERLQFDDLTIALDIEGTAGQAYRLYRAAFHRGPDLPGLTFWVHHMDAGISLADVSRSFVSSAEFQLRYAGLSDEQIVTQLYSNVLGRLPDPSGYEFWVGALDRASLSDVLIGFSESTENKAGVIGSLPVWEENGYPLHGIVLL